MLTLRFVQSTFSICIIAVGAGAAWGQEFPVKPVHMIASEAGGAGDFAARLIGQGLTGIWKQQVIVDNRGGAGGAIAIDNLLRSAPDGYTLLVHGSSLWLMPFLRSNVSWDPLRDFSPVTLAVSSPNLIVVHPSLPARTVRELIDLARRRPGELNYGSGLTGSSSQLAAELFKAMAGVSIVRIPYKGIGPALTALIGGQVQLCFANASAVAPHIKSDRLRALAVTSAQPTALAPDIPTVAAAALPGYESVSIFGVFAPARTPAALITRLGHDISKVLKQADVNERFFNAGVESVGSSPEHLAARMKSEMLRMSKVIIDAGIREE